jgi:hypothetical protein
MTPQEHADALVRALRAYASTSPDEGNRLNLEAAEMWLRLLTQGPRPDHSELELLRERVGRLPNVGSITADLRLACKVWLRGLQSAKT